MGTFERICGQNKVGVKEMTRKKCRKLLMSANVTKREAEEYMDNILPECGSYERLYISTSIYCILKNEEERNTRTQQSCYARCCL